MLILTTVSLLIPPITARILLNYKQIPYTTEWTEFPDIAHKFKSLGLTPNSDGTPYTCPMIRDSNGKYIMGSGAIAAELEKQYPEPPLYLDSPLLPKVQAAIMQVMGPLRAQASSTLLSDVLSERSADYWREKAEAKFGMPLATLQEQNAGEKAWEKVVPTIKEIGDLLKAEGGPFLMGKTGRFFEQYFANDRPRWLSC